MQPTVVCIMLVNGREAMVRRAIKSFQKQTYQRKKLLIYDTTPEESLISYAGIGRHECTVIDGPPEKTIGGLRNSANGEADTDAEILIHWDSDDWSHPNRIEEQVALLQSSKKQCVGYRDMLFWNQTEGHFCGAWFYSNPATNYCLGTSLCYWRQVWEARPFPDLPKKKGGTGEDVAWLQGVDSLGDVSLNRTRGVNYPDEPRMIASIHGSNTQYYGSDLLGKSTSWRRVPEWDGYAQKVMDCESN